MATKCVAFSKTTLLALWEKNVQTLTMRSNKFMGPANIRRNIVNTILTE